MRTTRIGLVLLVLIAAIALSCSKKSSPTQPGGGGGATEPFDSGVFSSGVFVHTYNTAGTFGYHCTVHGIAMSGSVTVATGMPDSNFVNIGQSGNSYSPSSISVKPGGYIKWTHVSGTHSVTSP